MQLIRTRQSSTGDRLFLNPRDIRTATLHNGRVAIETHGGYRYMLDHADTLLFLTQQCGYSPTGAAHECGQNVKGNRT